MSNIYPLYYIIFHSISVLFKVAKVKNICLKIRRAGRNPSPSSATNKICDLEKSLRVPRLQFHIYKIIGDE